MKVDDGVKNGNKYAWVICICGLAIHFCCAGLATTGIGVYLPYLREALELSNTQASMITTIRSLATTLIMFVSGGFYRRISLRRGIGIAMACIAIGNVLFSLAGTIWMCYAAAGVCGIGYGLGTIIPITALMRNWFQDRLATAISICTCGSGVTAAVAPVITILTETYGLKTAFMIETLFVVIVGIILLFIIRDHPSELNLRAYQNQKSQKKTENKKLKQNPDAKMPAFQMVMFLVVALLIGAAGVPGVGHLPLLFRTAGYTAAVTAAAVSMDGIVMTIGKFMFGVASDRFGTYRINYFFMGTLMLGMFFLSILNGTSQIMLYIAVFLFGTGIPVGTVGLAVWAGDLSSKEDANKMTRYSQILFSIGTLIFNLMPGVVADHTGSYAPVYFIYGIAMIVLMVMIQYLYLSRYKRKEIQES